MRISDWSSDVCSSDLALKPLAARRRTGGGAAGGGRTGGRRIRAGAFRRLYLHRPRRSLDDTAGEALPALAARDRSRDRGIARLACSRTAEGAASLGV